MNSGLAEVVCEEVGAAPYLIKHGDNGLLYRGESYEDFRAQVLRLMDDHQLINALGHAAYDTISKYWNPANAADQLLRFYENHINGRCEPPKEGPMSVAEVIKPI